MSDTESKPEGKLRGKKQHPVRSYFKAIDETRQQCRYCKWVTRLNATRMVKHITESCSGAPKWVQRVIEEHQRELMLKEENSPLVVYNKSNVHDHFLTSNDGKKRTCAFCRWTTIRNMTRMRRHLALLCTAVPPAVRSRLLKFDADEQTSDTECTSYRILSYSSDDQTPTKDIEIISSENVKKATLAIEEQIVGDDGDEVGEQPTEGTYVQEEHILELEDGQEVEIHEVSESSCTYCHKTIPYDTLGIEDGENVYCSLICLSNLVESNTQLLRKKKQEEQIKRKKEEAAAATAAAAAAAAAEKKKTEQWVRKRRQDDSAPAKSQIATAEVPSKRNKLEADEVEEKFYVPEPPTKAPTNHARPTRATFNEEGSCHSYAGGHVYPQEDVRSADHKLQWTKAVISRPAPDFEATAVIDGSFKKVKLSDYLGKYVVFFFYPLDFTFVCPTEILAFSDRAEEFRQINTQVIAASIDSHFTHLAWIKTPRKEGGLGKINIPLVSDITHSIAKDYGVYLDDLGHTLRGLFIVDDRGILRQITMNDLPVGRSVDETLRLVQAFQYTDKHGEVCPAGWKPGQDTIVPNPAEKIKYFEKNHAEL